ncbi:MAG: hypothetical protein FJ267_07715 [Planctomycetes bacterium]|nr:hypothetical protein [Planctomycetota bacterium]
MDVRISTSDQPVDSDDLGPPIEISNRSGSEAETLSSRNPLDLKAERISVDLQRFEGRSQPVWTSIETEGRVRIAQSRAAGQPPFRAEGDRLLMKNRGASKEFVHLFGSPAHLRDRGMHIEGRDVQLDRDTNTARVEGKGLLQLPMQNVSMIENFVGDTDDDLLLDVRWDESMSFNGKVAQFLGKVKTELGRAHIHCEQMDAALTTMIEFDATATSQQSPELESIKCKDSVAFDFSNYLATQLTEVLRGKVAEFTLDSTQNTFFAQGPGHIQLWQRSKDAAERSTGPSVIQQVNRPIPAVVDEWTYNRVDFKGKMTGLMNGELTGRMGRVRSTFRDSVRIVNGPVRLPNETIDRDNLPPKATLIRCEILEVVNHPKGPDAPAAYQQVIGKQNAKIEGNGFFASADELSFDGAKSLYTLRSYGNQNATITQESKRGQARETTGRRINFIYGKQRGLEQLYVDGLTGVSGSQ